MPTAKSAIASVFGRLFLRDSKVREISDPAPNFRAITLEGDDLRDVVPSASEKLEVYLPGAGMRTYTPIDWNSALGRATLLGYVHGVGPGAEWIRTLRVGDECRFFGPRRSIPFREMPGPVVFFGDETSFATLRAATTFRRCDDEFESVCEVGDLAASERVLRGTLELTRPRLVQRRSDGSHRGALVHAIAELLLDRPDAKLVLTGCAQSIQFVRATLREQGQMREGKVKAYWSHGKTGLD